MGAFGGRPRRGKGADEGEDDRGARERGESGGPSRRRRERGAGKEAAIVPVGPGRSALVALDRRAEAGGPVRLDGNRAGEAREKSLEHEPVERDDGDRRARSPAQDAAAAHG